MGKQDLPTFPNFEWDDYFWITSAKLPAWAGYQVRGGAYGSVSAKGTSDGTVKILFAPEGREDGPLTDEEVSLVKWVIDNQGAVHDAMLERLFEEYPDIRERYLEWLGEEEAKKALPVVRSEHALKKLVGVVSINVHQIVKDGKPYVGVELGCTWEVEHGLGVLLHGATPLEVGGTDTAILLWKAKRYANKA